MKGRLHNHHTERKAIHSVGCAFADFNWIFREQHVGDFGIDAIIETANEEPNGRFAAIQIKGGKYFKRSKSGLTLYFSKRHQQYWETINETMPVFLIAYDSITGFLHWEHFSENSITATKKQWKIIIPFKNVLNEDSKKRLEAIITKDDSIIFDVVLDDLDFLIEKEVVLRYFIKNKRLYCDLSIWKENIFVSIDFNYKPRKHWNDELDKLDSDDPYYYTLIDFEAWINNRYRDLRLNYLTKEALVNIYNELSDLLAVDGIRSLAAFMFDLNNTANGLPSYHQFVEAFTYYYSEKRDFEVMALEEVIVVKSKDEAWRIHTYEGLTLQLKHYIENRSYDEIYVMTNEYIWSEIYIDFGIEKAVFVPVILKEWELYWETKFKEVITGRLKYLEEQKDISRNKLTIFLNLYENTGDIIKLASELDDFILLPIAIISMLQIFDKEICYEEYCEHEFFGIGKWKSIYVNEEKEDDPMFFIQSDY